MDVGTDIHAPLGINHFDLVNSMVRLLVQILYFLTLQL